MVKTIMDIRPLTRKDYNAWLPLWQENCAHQIADDVTSETWRRLCHPKEPVFGMGLWIDGNTLAAFIHYVLHPTTGQIVPVCYLQDVFTAPDLRGQGLAKMLLNHFFNLPESKNWARIYWFVADDNPPAHALYKKFAANMPFTLYMRAT